MKKLTIVAQTFLAVPLSFIGIPIYLNVADFYAGKFALSLTLIGLLIMIIRGFDAIQDPFIGYFSDLLTSKKITRKKIIKFFSLFLCCGFYFVFNPPFFLSAKLAAIWFVLFLSLTYLSFNFVVINFEALIAIMAKDEKQRITLNSFKEFFGLIGMIMAFILPGILEQLFLFKGEQSYFFLSLIFIALLVISITIFRPKVTEPAELETRKNRINFTFIFKNKRFTSFLLIFLINSIAVSLPAANMNFYVKDVLNAKESLPWFLSTYFISACLFVPFWRACFNNFGIIKIWIISIFGSVLTFFYAYFLDTSTSFYFYPVCVFSGIFLGADLIAIPSILSRIVQKDQDLASSYFSLWNFATKFGLMIAASGSLIILGFFDYQPGNPKTDNLYLISFFYAVLPCFLKLLVIKLLLKFQKYEN